MTQNEFIRLVNGRPWADRACSMEEMDCWGLVVLYYRHALGVELHQIAGYESGCDFITCYERERTFWRLSRLPINGCLAVFYRGDSPAHVGIMVSPVKCLHSRGSLGFVRIDTPLALLRIYERVEYMTYGEI